MQFNCLYSENSYRHRYSLRRHVKLKHAGVPVVKNVRGVGKKTGTMQYKCHHCGDDFTKRSSLA